MTAPIHPLTIQAALNLASGAAGALVDVASQGASFASHLLKPDGPEEAGQGEAAQSDQRARLTSELRDAMEAVRTLLLDRFTAERIDLGFSVELEEAGDAFQLDNVHPDRAEIESILQEPEVREALAALRDQIRELHPEPGEGPMQLHLDDGQLRYRR